MKRYHYFIALFLFSCTANFSMIPPNPHPRMEYAVMKSGIMLVLSAWKEVVDNVKDMLKQIKREYRNNLISKNTYLYQKQYLEQTTSQARALAAEDIERILGYPVDLNGIAIEAENFEEIAEILLM